MKDFTRCSTATQMGVATALTRTELATIERFNGTRGVFPDDARSLMPARPLHRGVDFPAPTTRAWPVSYAGVVCNVDSCDRSWVVSDLGNPRGAIEFARQNAPGHGWTVTDTEVLCPDHATRKA